MTKQSIMNKAPFSRRDWLKSAGAFGLTLATAPFSSIRVLADEGPDLIDIGSRRELFVDDYLIAQTSDAELKLHKPVAREVVLTCDVPWEGNTSWGFASLADEGRFRAYYRGWHFDEKAKKMAHPPCSCYAGSRDGIHWVKPDLGLSEFNGSKENNTLCLVPPVIAPFKDGNPNCAPAAQYKTVGVGKTKLPGKDKPRHCLHAFKSPDGIHWSMMAEAVITEGAFDSQNLAFWDAERDEYRAYWRYFTAGYTDERGWKPKGYRAIRTATATAATTCAGGCFSCPATRGNYRCMQPRPTTPALAVACGASPTAPTGSYPCTLKAKRRSSPSPSASVASG